LMISKSHKEDLYRTIGKISRFSIFLPVWAILVSGCLPAAKPASMPACPPLPPLVEQTITREARKGTMKAIADLEVQAMGRRYPARIAIMARRPDLLRIESLPLIGTPELMLSIRGNQLRVFIPGKGEFYTGEASKHLSRFVPLPMAVQDIVSILMGAYPPPREGDCITQDTPDGDLRPIHILTREGVVRTTLWIKWPELTLSRLKTIGDDEKAGYTVGYSDYEMTNEVVLPGKIVIRSGGGVGMRQTINIRYSDMEISTEVDDQSFDLPIPAGVRPIELGGVEAPPNY
jgi:hypothetical protein